MAVFITPTSDFVWGRTITALSWSQIKNNYFLRLILNQEGVDTRRGCFLREKSGHYPSNKILVNEILALLQM